MNDGRYLIDSAQIFTLFFIMLGPLKVLGPFAQATHGLDRPQLRALAWKSAAIGLSAVFAGGLIGRALMDKWHIPAGALQLAAGIIFFLVAMQGVLAQYHPHTAPTQVAEVAPRPMQIAFPILVTPYGIASAILLLTLSHDAGRMATTLALLAVVMVLNLLSMVWVRSIMRPACVAVLQVLGAVLGVLQVALSIAIMFGALPLLGAWRPAIGG